MALARAADEFLPACAPPPPPCPPASTGPCVRVCVAGLSLHTFDRLVRRGCRLAHRPRGGYFVWVTLPAGVDADAVELASRASGVIIKASAPFVTGARDEARAQASSPPFLPPLHFARMAAYVGQRALVLACMHARTHARNHTLAHARTRALPQAEGSSPAPAYPLTVPLPFAARLQCESRNALRPSTTSSRGLLP